LFLKRCLKSATLGLLCLVGLAAALPVVVYLHFADIDAQRLRQTYGALVDRDRLLAATLAPILSVGGTPADEAVRDALARLAAAATRRWLLFIPADRTRDGGIRIAANTSSAEVPLADDAPDDSRPLRLLHDMPASCIPAEDSGKSQVMVSTGARFASIVPIPAWRGCWLLVSEDVRAEARAVFAGLPLVQLWDVGSLMAVYLLAVGAAVLSASVIWAGLRRFRTIAYDIGQYRLPLGSHGDATVMPELSGPAEVLDGLALDICRVSAQIRSAAEDNAHSLKTPLAVVRAAVGRVRRHIPDSNSETVHHALAVADQAVDRLFLLITTSQHLDEDTAALIVAPRQLIDLTELIEETVRQFADLIAARHIRCVLDLPRGIVVRAGVGHLDPVLRNVIDNAMSSLPEHGLLTLSLARKPGTIDLRIEDNGEGVAPDAVDRVFERDYSMPDSEIDDSDNSPRHARPGLFIVKRNIEALGGHVIAENIAVKGFAITITLPRPRR